LNNLSLLIHTFNGYNWLWQGCIDGWKKASLPDDLQIYFGTDIEAQTDIDFWRFRVIYSGDGNWSDRLVNLLSKLPTKYVLYAQEDHWPVTSVPDLGTMMQYVEKHDLLRLQIAPTSNYYTLSGAGKFSMFDPSSKYLLSHQPSIWDRQFFIKQVGQGEDPWVNEYEGTKRLNNTSDATRIAIYKAKWFHHACSKGKFIPPE